MTDSAEQNTLPTPDERTQQALKHATFLRRYLLRNGCEMAKTQDEVGIFDAILFLESLAGHQRAGDSGDWGDSNPGEW